MSQTKETYIKSSRVPLPLYLLNCIGLLGFGISIVLSQHYYDVRSGTAGFKSFCNINQAMNCDLVAASPWAQLIFELPIASFSAGWFLALFLISLFAHNRLWRRESIRALASMSVLGLLISIPYLCVMALELKTFCLLCLFIDGLNLLAVVFSLALRPEFFSKHSTTAPQWRTFGIVIGCSLLFTVVGLKASFDQVTYSSKDLNGSVQAVLSTPVLPVQATTEFPSIGPENAPITIVEFSDFQCPFCRIAAFSLNSAINRFPGKVRVVFRNFPLDAACNPLMQQSMHPVACEAARVAVCAHKQGKFEEVYKELFEQQASFAPGKAVQIAEKLGLDSNTLRGCLDSPEVKSAIGRDLEEAGTLGVQSTPVFFINGHRIEGARPAAVWIQVIEKLLR